ncbi:MAG: hypothetical protein E7668_05400 [Ruminococcaceae bacterium]|nr:hypothetical protein [Oscillospiraceae bacterium]
MALTSHERIMRIFQNKEIDRPALKLWGLGIHTARLLHPAYKPVAELAAKITDLFCDSGFGFNMDVGQNADRYLETYTTETNSPDWVDRHMVYHTSKGDLHSIKRLSTKGEPGYIMEYMIKEPEDIDKLLSMEFAPVTVNANKYNELVAQVGDRGVAMIAIGHAGYAVQELMGSETLAYFSIDERERLSNLIRLYSERLLAHTKAILDLGIKEPIFRWVGPEVYLPPLMGVDDFKEFVHDMDKPICDAVHNAGGYVWVHSHNKVAKFIDSFIDMGVDVLNPLEPPKNGDIDLNDIIAKYGNRIGWEGNIEIQEIIQASPERLRSLIDECVEAGNKSGRFILCPSTGYMEIPQPTEQYINNLMLYLRYGLEAVERCAK